MQNNEKKVNHAIVVVMYLVYIINYYQKESATFELFNAQVCCIVICINTIN